MLAMTPRRLQLSRRKGWKMPENTSTMGGILRTIEPDAIRRPRKETSLFPGLQSQAARGTTNETKIVTSWAVGVGTLRSSQMLDVREANHVRPCGVFGAEACCPSFAAARGKQPVSARTARSGPRCRNDQTIWNSRGQKTTSKSGLPEKAQRHYRKNGICVRSVRPCRSKITPSASPQWWWKGGERIKGLALSLR